MKSQAKYLLIIALFLGLFGLAGPVTAGCPTDITGTFTIENFQCTAGCEQLRVQYFEETVYDSTDNCEFCDAATVRARYSGPNDDVSSGKLRFEVSPHSSGLENPGFALWMNDTEIDGMTVPISSTADLTSNKFYLVIGGAKIQVFLQDGTGNLITDAVCLENCNIRVMSDVGNGDMVMIEDTCTEKPICKEFNISSSPQCGGGYQVDTVASDGELWDNLTDTADRSSTEFASEDLLDGESLNFTFNNTNITFDIIGHELKLANELNNQSNSPSPIQTTNDTQFWIILGIIFFIALVVWIITAVIQRKRPRVSKEF